MVGVVESGFIVVGFPPFDGSNMSFNRFQDQPVRKPSCPMIFGMFYVPDFLDPSHSVYEVRIDPAQLHFVVFHIFVFQCPGLRSFMSV
jgi:hypothetical protein